MTKQTSKALYWHQGMFLQSHHFQYQEQYTQNEINRQPLFSNVEANGVYRLHFNDASIKAGIVEIENLLAVLDDGTQIQYPGNCNLEQMTIDRSLFEQSDYVSVYVAIASIDSNDSNLSTDSQTKRYLLQDEPVEFRDKYDNDEKAALPVLCLDAKLYLGDRALIPDGMHCVEIGRVEQDGDNFKLSDSHVPSVVNLEASTVLKSLVKNIKQQLLTRYDQLESYNIFVSTDNKDITPSAFSNMTALQIVARYTPIFNFYEKNGSIKVEELYAVCSQLIGEMSIFSKRANVLGESNDKSLSLLPFSRQNLGDCFQRAYVLIKTLLDELTIDPELIVNMSTSGESKFVSPVSQDFARESNELYVRLRSENNLEEISEDICLNAKFGADGQADIYLKRALPGVTLKYLPRKPIGVAGTANSYFFVFARNESQWHKVLESGRAAFIWPDAPSDLIVDLIAVRG